MKGEWVLSVGQLNEYVRRQLACDPLLRQVQVRGEITGFKRHYSGHLYFSIKDEQARVQCVMFRQNATGLDFEPRDGQQVVISGAASLYPQTGSFQLYCQHMRREGAGELFLRFQALKEKLGNEGLFDPGRKKPIPRLPGRVGIITSRSGAALRDIIKIARRRNPWVPLIVCPAQVQGEGAARDIAGALERLGRKGHCDLILLGRGGGSMEDLWAFNEEIVARAIAACPVPVISCVGHETDFTISDFVADVRAATPSMAAELAVPVAQELVDEIMTLAGRMARAQQGRITLLTARLEKLEKSLQDPVKAISGPRREKLDRLALALSRAQGKRMENYKARLTQLSRTLEALNPGNVLSRGYALLRDEKGPVTSIKQVKPGQTVGVVMADGKLTASVLSVKEEKTGGGQKETEL